MNNATKNEILQYFSDQMIVCKSKEEAAKHTLITFESRGLPWIQIINVILSKVNGESK